MKHCEYKPHYMVYPFFWEKSDIYYIYINTRHAKNREDKGSSDFGRWEYKRKFGQNIHPCVFYLKLIYVKFRSKQTLSEPPEHTEMTRKLKKKFAVSGFRQCQLIFSMPNRKNSN